MKQFLRRSPVYLIWIVGLIIYFLIQVRVIGFFTDGLITYELSARNPDADGPQLFPAFIVYSFLIVFLVSPFINYFTVIIIGRFIKRLTLTRNERVGLLFGLPSILLLLLAIIISITALILHGQQQTITLNDITQILRFIFELNGPPILYLGFITFCFEFILYVISRNQKTK